MSLNMSYQNRNNMSQFDRLNRISDKLNNVNIKNIILKIKYIDINNTKKFKIWIFNISCCRLKWTFRWNNGSNY
jgi:hypothetical protein